MSGQSTPAELLARLRDYLQSDPDNAALRADIFDVALAAGDLAAARLQVEHAERASPGDPGWKHRGAVLLLATSRYAEAEHVLEDLIREGHDAPPVRFNLAYALYGQGQHVKALASFEALLGSAEVAAMAWAQWLRCAHRLSLLDEALRRFRASDAQGTAGAEARGVASLMAVDASSLGEARAWSERALRERPDQIEALVARASVALADQDEAGARTLFERALNLKPEDGRTWSGLAYARMMGRDFEGAERAFEKAVASMPDHIGTWLGRGWCSLFRDAVEPAKAYFEEALRLDRNFGESHGALAVALARLGDREGANHEIELALRLDPVGLSAHYARAVLSGEASDLEALRRLARQLFSMRRKVERQGKAP